MPSVTSDPAAGTSEGAAGLGTAWSSPGDIVSSNDARATSSLAASTTTRYLKATYDFSAIPDTAEITGIQLAVERSATSTSGSPKDAAIRLSKTGLIDEFVGDDKKSADVWPTTDGTKTYGGAADLWNTTWTVAEIKALGFSVWLRGSRGFSKTGPTLRVDHMPLTVHYTEVAGGNRRRRVLTSRAA